MQTLKMERKDYPAVGEAVYQTTLRNGLRVFLYQNEILMKLMGL